MKTVLWISLGIVVVVALAVVGLAAGWALWGRQLWAASSAYAMDRGPGYGEYPGLMPGMRWAWGDGSGGSTEWAQNPSKDPASEGSDGLTIEDAHETVERYLRSRGYEDLEIAEAMAFEQNYYAIAREHDTGIGAMELLVDRESGIVGPEMGPNMMWNERYGMHRRGMMGSGRRGNTITPDEAVEGAQRWLDANRPGRTADEHAVTFYGYYTIHTLADGEIEGMLSVHGTTGQVWYHNWHGEFVDAIGGDEAH